MTEIKRIIAQCFLEGESYISVVYDDVTLDISYFELRGDTSATLNIYILEPDIDEEIILTPPSNLGENVIQIAPVQQWKMIDDEGIRLPDKIKLRAEWIV